MLSMILGALVFGVFITLLVALYGFFIMPLTGRPKWVMPLKDMILMVLIMGLIVWFLLWMGWLKLWFQIG